MSADGGSDSGSRGYKGSPHVVESDGIVLLPPWLMAYTRRRENNNTHNKRNPAIRPTLRIQQYYYYTTTAVCMCVFLTLISDRPLFQPVSSTPRVGSDYLFSRGGAPRS